MKATTGSRLPALTLPDATSGAETPLRSRRGPVAVIAVHPSECADCLSLVRKLAAAADRVTEWGGQLIVVVPAAGDDSGVAEPLTEYVRTAGPGVRVVLDPEGRLGDGPEPAILIADEWGEVYFADAAKGDHRLIGVDEVIEWVRFVGIQCPECEGPEGPWGALAGP